MKRVSFLSGVAWMSAGTILTRLGSLVTQIVLVFFLVKEDFGVYAIVIAFYLLSNSLRDAGVNHYLTHKGADKFISLSISAFWLAFTFNIIIALSMVIAAPYIADYYSDNRITKLLGILAISVPLRTHASILINKLSIDGKFTLVAKITTTTALLKFSSWIILSWLGFGPYSFVLAIPFIAILEGIWSYTHEKISFKTNRLNFSQWHIILKATSWIIVGQFAVALLQVGDYLMLGLFLSKGMLGVYYFSFELVAQVGVLLANNVQKVLYPSLTNLKGNVEEQRHQLINALILVMSIGPFLSMLIAVSIEPLSHLLGWSERFPGIVVVVQLLALFFPLRILTIFTSTTLMTLGKFKKLAVINIIQGIGLIIVTYGVSNYTSSLSIIALSVGSYFGSIALFFAYISMREFNITFREIAKNVIALWVLISVIAIISHNLGVYFITYISKSINNISMIYIGHIIISTSIFITLYLLAMILTPQTKKFTSLFITILFRKQ